MSGSAHSDSMMRAAPRAESRTQPIAEMGPHLRAESRADLRSDVVVNALMVEYQSIHKRVLGQLGQYEDTNTKILMLIGVLYYFGLAHFGEVQDTYIHTIANLIFLAVIPLVAIASVAFTAANLIKIMIWGDFLKTIEDKVNVVLGPEARFFEFDRGQVLSWEYWRVAHGYAGKSNFFSVITFSGFLVITFVAASIISVWIRLQFILHECPASYTQCRGIAIFMAALFVFVSGFSLALFMKQRTKSMKGVLDDGRI